MGANEDKRRAVEDRLAGIDGFTLMPHGGGLVGADVVVVVTDREGFGVTRRIAARAVVAQPPMMLVVDEPFEELVSVMWFGARGIILSSASDREMADCAMLVAQRCTVVSERVLEDERLGSGGLAFEWTLSHDSKGALDALSRREMEVLSLVGTGRTNTEIAEKLWLSSNTVRSHVQRLMRKLGVRNRLCLIIFAHELGLVNLDDVVLSGDDTMPNEPCSLETGLVRETGS
ncbi:MULTISPECIES: LuxR C-terminal-related transcriptional regulator [Streptomyces]|uniref:LuxR C-terminal-related transcriptional regulator n=2 Tax=Streptomyces TaxID=1883 RepID=A0ABV9J4R0_9ACTN